MVNCLEKGGKKVEGPPTKIQSHHSLSPMKEPGHSAIKVGRVELFSKIFPSHCDQPGLRILLDANTFTPTERWWVTEEEEYRKTPLHHSENIDHSVDIEYSLQSHSLLTRLLGWRGSYRVSLHMGAGKSSRDHMRDQGRLLLPPGKPTSKSVNLYVIYVNGKKAVRRLRRSFCESSGTRLGL